jgi:hypothetical protein
VKKKFLIIATLFALAISIPQALKAQDSSTQDNARKLPTPEEVVAMLDSKLSLTDDQKAQIAPLIADRQQQLRAAAANDSTRRFKKARKMKSIYEDSDKKINAILTDDQKKKYAEIEQQMHEQMKERRQQAKNNSGQ